MVYTQLESKRIIDNLLSDICKSVKRSKNSVETVEDIKLCIKMISVIQDNTQKKKKKSKKRKVSPTEDESSSTEVVPEDV